MSAREQQRSRLAKAPPPNSIRYFRRKAGLSRAEVGALINLSGETVRKLEQRHTWLDADRAKQIGDALGISYDVLGFSYASDAYAWAVKALPVVGKVIEADEVKFETINRHIAGGAHLPPGCVALEITVGKLRGWHLVYQEHEKHSVSQDILRDQEISEKHLVHLINGTTWWRRIQQSSVVTDLYHLSSRHLATITDTRIAWVSEVIGFVFLRYELPSPTELNEIRNPASAGSQDGRDGPHTGDAS